MNFFPSLVACLCVCVCVFACCFALPRTTAVSTSRTPLLLLLLFYARPFSLRASAHRSTKTGSSGSEAVGVASGLFLCAFFLSLSRWFYCQH